MKIKTKRMTVVMLFAAFAFTACDYGGDTASTVTPSSAKSIMAFSFISPFAPGVINETDYTIKVTVPYLTNVTALKATFTTSGSSVKVGATVQESGITVIDFTNPVIYTVAAADSSTQDYAVTVVEGANVTTTTIAGNISLTIDIAGTSARGGGRVPNQVTLDVTERGLCWNMVGNPTLSDSHVADGLGKGTFTNSLMSGLTANTKYYVRAYATTVEGTVYGDEVTFNSGWTFGSEFGGGYVFYNDGYGGGLVSAQSDQSTSQDWIDGGSTDMNWNGNTSTAIGTGLANSYAILFQNGHTDSAAKACLDYDDGTYIDWFLPSKDELNLMYTRLRLADVGGFADNFYWSSSEYNIGTDSAWTYNFSNGNQFPPMKMTSFYVRAVRAFEVERD